MKFKFVLSILPPKPPELKGEQELPPLKSIAEAFERRTGVPRLSCFDARRSPKQNFERILKKPVP
jgi:hypothetical protein